MNKQTGTKFRNWKVWAIVVVAVMSALLYWGTRPVIDLSEDDQVILSAAFKVWKQMDKAMASGERQDADLVIQYAQDAQVVEVVPLEFHDKWVDCLQAVVSDAEEDNAKDRKDLMFFSEKWLQELTETILKAND